MCATNSPETGPTSTGAGLWSPALRLTTVGLVLSITLVALEALAVITILPLVSADLGGIGLYGWVISAFSLGTMFGIVVAGRETDRRGPATPFIVGLGMFAAGLLIGGLAPSMVVLVGARGLQGIGAGAIPSVAYASIGRTYPASMQPRVFAILSTAWVVPGLIGPGLAALVAVHAGWRWVFLGLIPLVLGIGGMTVLPLLRLGAPPRGAASQGQVLDAVRVAAAAGLLVGGLGARSVAATLSLMMAAAAVGVVPLLRILPIGTLRARRGLPAAVLSRGLLTFAFFGTDTFVPLSLTSARGQSATVAGVAVTSATLAWATGAWVQERKAASWGIRGLVGVGFALLALGIGGVALVLIPAVPIPVAIGGWLVAGLGIGVAYAQISVAVLRAAPAGQEGSSSASMQLFDTLGVALGSGLGGAAVGAGAAAGWPAQWGIAIAFSLAGLAAVAGIVVARRILVGSQGDDHRAIDMATGIGRPDHRSTA